jgi:type IX secretion system PorP/SprF family membrane protein
MREIAIIAILLLNVIDHSAQEIQFSQFFNAPLYYCPSNAGTYDGTRVVANYRDQWPGISNTYVTYMLSVDHYISALRSGIGFAVSRDQSGDLGLRSTKFYGIYSYDFKAFGNWRIRPGLQFSYSINDIDYSKLRLREQIVVGAPSPTNIPDYNAFSYYDAAASVMFYSRKQILGFKIDHLAMPVQVENTTDRIPFAYTVYGMYDIELHKKYGSDENPKIIPAFNFTISRYFRQLDIGVMVQWRDVEAGAWYRGLPVSDRYYGRDAFIISLGYTFYNIKLGVSHDFTASGISQSANGANEVSLIVLFESQVSPKKKFKALKCHIPQNEPQKRK